MRECFKLSKEYVANEIGYSVRNLERIEKENAIVTEETAKKLYRKILLIVRIDITLFMLGEQDFIRIVLQVR